MRKSIIAAVLGLVLAGCNGQRVRVFTGETGDSCRTSDLHIWEVMTTRECDTVLSSDFYLGRSAEVFYFYIGNDKSDVVAAYPRDVVLHIKKVEWTSGNNNK